MPHLKEDKVYSDPVATDLVGALLAVRLLLFHSFLFRTRGEKQWHRARLDCAFYFPRALSLSLELFCCSLHTTLFFSLFVSSLVPSRPQSPRTAWESRRSSEDSARLSTIRAIASPTNTRIQMKNFRGPQEIAEILDKSLDWDFEIFKLEVLTERR